MILSATALDIARQCIGIREEGPPNSGPEVDAYLASVGLAPGYPWCAAWLHWVFRRAAKTCGLVNPFPRTASSLKVWTFAEPVCRDSNPAAGYVYVLKHSETTGHVGIVERIDADGITEISGNTNEAGSREGNAVARHKGQPEVVHGGELLGYLNFDLAAQAPNVVA